MTLEKEITLEQRYVMPTFSRSPVEFVAGRGMFLLDSEGHRFLDFLSGIGVCSLGHCHPAVVGAIKTQASKLIHVSNYFYIDGRGELAERISRMLNAAEPIPEDAAPWKTFFANSGAEANECAIKLARIYAKSRMGARGKLPEEAPTNILTLAKSFHGRTLGTMAATGQKVIQDGFDPIPVGFPTTPINDIQALKEVFSRLGKTICAVMLEPIQGESGVHECTPEFLRAVREITNMTGALMIADEVQCGMYRTGRPFAFQHFGITPDIVTIAKGVASGMPAAACAARFNIADAMSPGKHGSTFGGSNLACAAANATLEQMARPGFGESVELVGTYLRNRLSQIRQVEAVRGMGLMVGVDINSHIDAHEVVSDCLEGGLILNATGRSTLRLLPPLICSREDVDVAIGILSETLARLAS